MLKRWIAGLLVCILLCSLVACNSQQEPEDTASTSSYSVDVFGNASNGVIPELELHLGDTVSDFEAAYDSAESDDEDAIEYSFTASVSYGEEIVTMKSGKANFYYQTDMESYGISRIFSFADSYGFAIGMATYIEDLTAALGSDYTTDFGVTVSALYNTTCDVVTYFADESHQLNFYFVDDNLAAVELLDTRYWTEETSASSADASSDDADADDAE